MAKCVTALVRLTFDQMYPLSRDILWKTVTLLHLCVRLTCGQVYAPNEALGQVDLWSDVPPGRDILWPSDTTAPLCQVVLWSDVPPMGRDILWPSVILLQVRLTCLCEGKSGARSHSNSSTMNIY